MPITNVPDSVLDKIRCRCGQYLSKLPINIHDGESICKDCLEERAPSPIVAARNIPYEALAAQFAFPCQYKGRGCPKYVEFNRLELHEAKCSYRLYECPVNLHLSCNWKGTITRMCQHYLEDHSELYLASPMFKIRIDEDHETYRLYQMDDVLLLLQSKCVLQQGKVWFNMVCFKQDDSVSFINYSITLNNPENKEFTMKLEVANPLCIAHIQMVPEKCIDVSIATMRDFLKNPEFIECNWAINISDELKKRIKNQQKLEDVELYEARNERIKCLDCGIYMVPPIFRCCNEHITCVDCKGYYNECKMCQRNNIQFVRAIDLEETSKSEQHYCKWLNCRVQLGYTKIRQHEQSCFERIYTCPKCWLWSGILDELLNHFKAVHPQTVIYFTPSISFNSQDYLSAYVIAHREIFKLIIGVNTINGPLHGLELKIDLWYLGAPSIADRWEYKVTENSGNSWNLSRLLNHLSGTIVLGSSKNEAQMTVPNSGIVGKTVVTNSSIFSVTSSPSIVQSQLSNTGPTPSLFGVAVQPNPSTGLFSGFQSPLSKETAAQNSQNKSVCNKVGFTPIGSAKLHGSVSLHSPFQMSACNKRIAANKRPNNANGEPGKKTLKSHTWRFYTLTISKPTLYSL